MVVEGFCKICSGQIYYHGSNTKFTHFDISFAGKGNDTYGPGIYFSKDINTALGYGRYLYKVKIGKLKLVSTKPDSSAPRRQVENLIRKAPGYKETLENWDENPQRAFLLATNSFLTSSLDQWDLFQSIWYDFYRYHPKAFLEEMIKLGYDGAIPDSAPDHLVLFNVVKIESMELVDKMDQQSLLV